MQSTAARQKHRTSLIIDSSADVAAASTWILTVSGEIDPDTAPQLRAALHNCLLQRPTGIMLDLAGVEFMDSSGICALVEASTALAAHGGVLTVGDMSPTVKRVLELTGLLSLLGEGADPEE